MLSPLLTVMAHGLADLTKFRASHKDPEISLCPQQSNTCRTLSDAWPEPPLSPCQYAMTMNLQFCSHHSSLFVLMPHFGGLESSP